MILGKINLAALNHAVEMRKTKAGESIEVITIPIKANSLFKSDKGNVYLDFAAFELSPDKRKGDDSHLISQSLPKEQREALKAAGKYPPSLGSMKVDGAGSAPIAVASTESSFDGGGDDLPF